MTTSSANIISFSDYASSGMLLTGRHDEKLTLVGGIPPVTSATFYHEQGHKYYEMSNHLGNVLTVITDKKTPLSITGTQGSPVDGYTVHIVNANDYTPFGVQMDGRKFESDEYRYGFQGQEMDDEIKGEGNSANYKYRMHDSRIGRFFAIDPMSHVFPHNSPYAFSENIVINAIELEGLESHVFFKTADEGSKAKHELVIAMKVSVVDERINDTGHSIDECAKHYRSEVRRLLKGTSTDGKTDFQVAVINLDVAANVKAAQNTIIIHIVDEKDEHLKYAVTDANGVVMKDASGNVVYSYAAAITVGGIGETQKNDIYISDKALYDYKSAAHETGHILGLRHPMAGPGHTLKGHGDPQSKMTTQEDSSNLMSQSADTNGTRLLNKQFNFMFQEVVNDTGQKMYKDGQGNPTWSKTKEGKTLKKYEFK